MKTSENNDAENGADGTAPSDDTSRQKLQQLRTIATQMFHFMEEFPWLEQTPDYWILEIMQELRKAATNLYDYDAFRTAFLKAGAGIFAAIQQGDKLFLDYKGPVPLPESIFGKDT